MNATDKMLDSIEDESIRQQIRDILYKKIVANIICNSKICKDTVIGFIDDRSRITPNNASKHYLRRHRMRLDGQYGFLCSCGNDSSIARQEQGIVGPRGLSKEDLERVAENLEIDPAYYPRVDNQKQVDGFTIAYLGV